MDKIPPPPRPLGVLYSKVAGLLVVTKSFCREETIEINNINWVICYPCGASMKNVSWHPGTHLKVSTASVSVHKVSLAAELLLPLSLLLSDDDNINPQLSASPADPVTLLCQYSFATTSTPNSLCPWFGHGHEDNAAPVPEYLQTISHE